MPSHESSIRTIRNGLAVVVEEARASSTGFCKSSGSNSGTTKHGPVHR